MIVVVLLVLILLVVSGVAAAFFLGGNIKNPFVKDQTPAENTQQVASDPAAPQAPTPLTYNTPSGWKVYDNKPFQVRILLPADVRQTAMSVPVGNNQTIGLTLNGSVDTDGTFYGLGLASMPLNMDFSNPKAILTYVESEFKANKDLTNVVTSYGKFDGYDTLEFSYVNRKSPETPYYKGRVVLINKIFVMPVAISVVQNPPNYSSFNLSLDKY